MSYRCPGCDLVFVRVYAFPSDNCVACEAKEARHLFPGDDWVRYLNSMLGEVRR